MEKNEKVKLLKFNSTEQCNLVLFDAIKQQNPQRLFYLVEERCYSVTPFVLNLMIDFGMENQLPKLLEVCKCYDVSIYDWLCIYWGRDKTDDFCCQNSFDDIVRKKILEEALIRNETWDALLKRGRLCNIPDDWLLAHPSHDTARMLLTRNLKKHADWALEHKIYSAFVYVKNGYKYLLKAGLYGYVLENYGRLYERLSIQEIEKILQDNKDTKYWVFFQNDLLAAGLPDVCLRNHSTDERLLCAYPERVDWEYLWEHNDEASVRERLLKCAAKNKKITKDFLQKHRPKSWWRCLFG